MACCLRFFTNESSSDIPLSLAIANCSVADFLDPLAFFALTLAFSGLSGF